MKSPTTKGDQFILEANIPFSQSLIWGLQRNYFTDTGIDAWRQNEVPHYVVSNPTMAKSYAEVIFALYRDSLHLYPDEKDEPLTICELGAGSGRFGFHVLSFLSSLCEQYQISLSSFRYILSDFNQDHLDFYNKHRCFQPYIESGVLDVARFDVEKSVQLQLQASGKTITRTTLSKPIVVIANYLFDTIPQDLFFIKDGEIHECLVSLSVDSDPGTLNARELLAGLNYRYDYRKLKEPAYSDSDLDYLLTKYQNILNNSHVLLPSAGIRCLKRLKALSKSGLVLLSADKGKTQLDEIQGNSAPRMVRHGSFSLPVNYHALASSCEQQGGLALFPDHSANSVIVSCMMMLENPTNYLDTKGAYHRYIQDFSPDDFFAITKHSKTYIKDMSIQDIFAYIRLGHYDAHQFNRYLPRLFELTEGMTANESAELCKIVDRVWQTYFPLAEDQDLAFGMANLLYKMDRYELALGYFQKSNEIYGAHSGTLYNMATCHHLLEQDQLAEPLLNRCLELEPGNQAAIDALKSITAGVSNVNSLPN